MTDKTSMLYWYPTVEKLKIPAPQTFIIEADCDITEILQKTGGDCLSERSIEKHIDMKQVYEKAKILGYPLFLRSDMTSNKHAWKNTCYVTKESDIIPHLQTLMCYSQLADIINGIPFRAVVLRKYIPMWTLFRAFSMMMPVNPEWRLFAKDGKIICEHWYWIKEAIRHAERDEFPAILDHWERVTATSLPKLRKHARAVSKALPNQEWSIDFCKTDKGDWLLIDMAVAEKSWHPKCKKRK